METGEASQAGAVRALWRWLADAPPLQAFTRDAPQLGQEVSLLPLGNAVLRDAEISLESRARGRGSGLRHPGWGCLQGSSASLSSGELSCPVPAPRAAPHLQLLEDFLLRLELVIGLPVLVALHIDALPSAAPSRRVQGLHLPRLPHAAEGAKSPWGGAAALRHRWAPSPLGAAPIPLTWRRTAPCPATPRPASSGA